MKCKSGYYYCYTDQKCKKIPAGLKMTSRTLGGGREPEEVGIDKPLNGNDNGNGNGGVSESKSGDSSLRDWFSKSKSSDGKPGWVQLGGKYAGKPCAKQPGQTTKPKCGSSKMKRNLSKDEEERAFRRKNRQDPNPDRKGKAINVKTEETIVEKAPKYDKQGNDKFDRFKRMVRHKQDKYGPSTLKQRLKHGGVDHNIDNEKKAINVKTEETVIEGKKDACYHKVKSRYSVWPSAYASGALVKCRKVGAKNWGNKTKKEGFSDWRDELLDEGGKKCWKGYKKVGTQKLFGKTYNRCVKEEGAMSPQELQLQKKKAMIDKMIAQKRQQQLAKSKKEESPTKALGEEKNECNHTEGGVNCPIHGISPCGKSSPKGGDGGKIGPNKNYVKPMGEDIELTDAYGETFAVVQDLIKPEPLQPTVNNIDYDTYDIDNMVEAVRVPAKNGNIVMVSLMWRGKYYGLRIFFPSVKMPSRSDVQDQIQKVYPGAKVISYSATDYEPGNPLLHAEGAAWTKKEGKNKSGGLNEKGRKSYERENPGSDLKAPSKKVGNPRRASFCARMKGMKKKLTSKKTASDPDSRINKSLRAWNC